MSEITLEMQLLSVEVKPYQPTYASDTRHNHHLCIDPNHCVSVHIPHYPGINDVIEVEGCVADVDTDSDEVKCHPLAKWEVVTVDGNHHS